MHPDLVCPYCREDELTERTDRGLAFCAVCARVWEPGCVTDLGPQAIPAAASRDRATDVTGQPIDPADC